MKKTFLKFMYLLNIFIPQPQWKNLYKKYINIKGAELFLQERQKQAPKPVEILPDDKIYWSLSVHDRRYIQYAFPHNQQVKNSRQADVIFKWGMNRTFRCSARKKVFIMEDSFLRSQTTVADKKAKPEDKLSISFTLDDLAPHFCGNYVSRLEQKINSDEKLKKEDIGRARKCIDKIVGNYLTKYNHQPIFVPEILKTDKHKVLIIDQSVGDYSIILGGNGKHRDFEKMLQDAVRENPDSLIFVKVHPDTLAHKKGNALGYFSPENTGYPNVILFAENVNPVAVLQNVDKVYVWSSGMGFEALMCGKEVVTYGTPFYAGWGITTDRNRIFKTAEMQARRNKKRCLEELFYYSYIWYSHYVDAVKNCPCEIETAIDYLLQKRDEYFAVNNIRKDL
ncbi:MAG: hypothetical protein Q4D80_03325 [Pseudomonadota bacterium]|nr:hypothetical protein [Pseudomonadota bacterium]